MNEHIVITEIFTSDLVKRALAFAANAHAGQQRKYTGDQYIIHPVTVAGLVAGVGGSKAMVAAALLHDVVEDCGVSHDTVAKEFGQDVADLVYWLTDISKPEDGNRAKRKMIDRTHMANAPAEAKTIKLADMIDNSNSIVSHDPDFAEVYMREKRDLLVVLVHGDSTLFKLAAEIVNDYFAKHPEVK